MVDEIARTVGWVVVHSLWQGAAVALVAAALLAALPAAAARARHAILLAALAAHLAAPLATAFLLVRAPAWALQAGHHDHRAPVVLPRSGEWAGGPLPTVIDVLSVAPRPTLTSRVEPFLPLVAAVWLLGAIVGGARLAGGWLFLRRLVARAEPVPERLGRLPRRLGIRRAVRLFTSSDVAVPFTCGWLRPVILLPAYVLTGLDPFHVDAILIHELAHVRRRDYLVGLLQSLAQALLYYHPATWWLDRRLRAEREHCCDDRAVQVLGDRAGYALALAELESRRLGLPSLAMAATDGSLLTRIERIVGAPRPASRWGWVPAVVLLLLLATAGALQAGPAGETLAARWDRAAASRAVVIGWRIRSAVTGDELVISSTDGSSRARGPRVAELAGGERRGVAILVDWSSGIEAVRLRSLGAEIALRGRPLLWLGSASDGESLALLQRLMAATGSAHLRSELGAALALHDDRQAVVRAVERVLDSDADARVRGETLAWLGRHGDDAAALALLRRGIEDASALVRDEAVTVLMAHPLMTRAELAEIARTARYGDVRAEIAERLARESR